MIVWRGGALRAYRDRVYALRDLAPPASLDGSMSWTPPAPITLPGGTLWARAVSGTGLRASGPLDVRFRRGGERCRPHGRAHSQTLRRLLQEYHVPPWERPRLPLLYRDGELVAVADLWVCAGHHATPPEPGWQLHWGRTNSSV